MFFKHVITNPLTFCHFLYLKIRESQLVSTSSARVQCDMGCSMEKGHFSSVPAQCCFLGWILYLAFIRCVQQWQQCQGQGTAAHVMFLTGSGYI